jgi:hypothetical protein
MWSVAVGDAVLVRVMAASSVPSSSVATVPLLIIDDFGMRKLPLTAAEDLLEIISGAMNVPAPCSLPIGPWRTGGNCWAMWLQLPPCSTASCITGTCSNAAREAGGQKLPMPELLNECRPGASLEQNQIGKGLLYLGTPSPNPWDLPPFRQNGGFSSGRLTPPRRSGRWVGARVASLRCLILRPGEASINRQCEERRKLLPKVSTVG